MFENAAAIVRTFYADLVQGGSLNHAALDAHVAAAFRGHHLPPGCAGREGYKKFLQLWGCSFSEVTPIEVCDLFSAGDKVVVRWSCTSWHSGEFMGFAATRRRITTKGIDIFRARDGKIVELWQELDLLGILQQISAPPAR